MAWEISSNSSNATEHALAQDYVANAATSTILFIPAELLSFGVHYNLTVLFSNVNNVSKPVNWTSFTTFGGSYCENKASFPDFTIESTFNHAILSHVDKFFSNSRQRENIKCMRKSWNIGYNSSYSRTKPLTILFMDSFHYAC